MVKFNFWESFYKTKYPKRFKKEARKQIEQNTLNYLKNYGRVKWIPVTEVFKETLEQTDLFNSGDGKIWFAEQGIKSKINSATHKLRKDGHPIIAGLGKKGYMYADENCNDFIEVWEDKFKARDERKRSLDKEERNDDFLVGKIIVSLIAKNRFEEAEKLKEVLIQYQR